MHSSIRLLSIALVGLASSTTSHAVAYRDPAAAPVALPPSNDISLGVPGYGGNGCPAGSASITLSPDSKTLSVLFDQYSAEAGRTTGRRLDRKSCNIAIPVHVPQGLSVSIFQVDYRGFTSIPRGASATFTADYFFAGQTGPRASRRFSNADEGDYLIRNILGAAALVFSPCGADVNLRVNTSMTALSNSYMEQTLATVDSVDTQGELVYHLQWQRCR